MSYVKKVKKLGKDICPEGSVIRGRTARTAIKSIRENDCGGSSGGEDMLQARIDATNSCKFLFYYYTGDNVDYIANLDTSNVTNMTSMFSQCTNLTTIPQLDTSNVTNMTSMFQTCRSLTSIPQLNTSNVTSMTSMFTECTNLTTIPLLDTSNVTSMTSMFRDCSKLTTIPQLDVSNVTDMLNIFVNCPNLKSILMYGMKVNFNIAYTHSNKFEVSDLVTILSNCQVVTSTKKFTMDSDNLAKLEGVYVKLTGVELYEGITCNPCVICESTEEGAMLATDYFTSKGWTLA